MSFIICRITVKRVKALFTLLVVLVDRPTSNEHEGLEDENNDITKKAGTLVHKEPDKEVAKTRAVIDLSTAPLT